MKIPSSPSASLLTALSRPAIAIALAAPLILVHSPAAQANLIDTIRGIFTGQTGEGATGTSNGAAIRDEFCEPDASVVPAQTWRLSALVPETAQQTAQAIPTIFVYLNLEPVANSQTKQQHPPTHLKQGIGTDDYYEDHLDQFRTGGERIDLLLEIVLSDEEHNSYLSQYYVPLPDDDAVVELPLALESPLEVGQTYEWTVRLLCRTITPQGSVNNEEVESLRNEVERSTLSGVVTRVPSNTQLESAIASNDPETRYQAYIDNKLWFELVADLSTAPNSPEWRDLLDAWNFPPPEVGLQRLQILREDVPVN